MSDEQDRVAARRRMGARLRGLREAKGWTGQHLAEGLGWSQAKVSRIEMAKTRTEVPDISALLDTLEVPSGPREELISLAEEAAGPRASWRNSSGVGLTRRQQDFIAAEAAAAVIRHYQPLMLPGYLQEPAYARRVIELTGTKDVERALEHRLARRAVLTSSRPPRYDIVLMEAALRWRPVEPLAMAEQLQAVAAVARRSNVSLWIIDYTRTQQIFVQHPFVFYDFADNAPAEVLVETSTTDLHIRDQSDVSAYSGWFERLVRSAMSPAVSIKMIHRLAREMVSSA